MTGQEMVIWIESEPRASARAVPFIGQKMTADGGTRPYVAFRTDKGAGGTIAAWRRRVIGEARIAMAAFEWATVPAGVPVLVDVDWIFKRPGVPPTLQPRTQKPDRDNLDKAILDPLTRAGVWHDDCQPFAGDIAKWDHPQFAGARVYLLSGDLAVDRLEERRKFLESLIAPRLKF